jgi:hypothetical protein
MTTTQTVPSTPDLDLIIRIEKLLAKAEDAGATEAEQEAFQAKAFELMERHRIDRNLIGGHLASDDKITTEKIGDFNGIYGRVRIAVVHSVAAAYDVEIFWSGYKNFRALKGYGFSSDIERVRVLSNRLLADADLRCKYLSGYDQKETLRYRRSFYLGYADSIGRRLKLAHQHAMETAAAEGVDTTSVALVLVDRKKQVNDSFRAGVGAKLKSAGGINGINGGYDKGAEAGSQADLSHNNSVGSRKALGQ